MSETSEMVERVARAICASSNRDPDRIMPEFMGEVNVPEWRYDVDEAVAAIRAMREPTEAMTRAGVDFALGVSLSGEYRWTDYIADMHRRQIDAALPSPAKPG